MSKRYLKNLETYQPGKPIEEVKREMDLKEVIKMASNENPLGPSPKAVEAVKKNLDTVNLYPDGSAFYLRKTLEKRWGLEADRYIIGNGSDEIVMLLAATFLEEGDSAIIGWPSFVVYPLVIKKFGGRVISLPLKDYRFDLSAMARALEKDTKLIFIANPNNPTGTIVRQAEIEKFLKQIPESVIIVFDEAYAEFVDDFSFPETISMVKGRPNVVMLRTFSKLYGLAGLRIGYGISSKEIAAYLNKMREPFNVNRLAQIAAIAALEDDEFVKKTKETIIEGRDFLYKAFKKRKIEYIPTSANFILLKLPLNGVEAFERLLKEGVIVRPLKECGLLNFVRVTIGTSKENRKFIDSLDKVLG